MKSSSRSGSTKMVKKEKVEPGENTGGAVCYCFSYGLPFMVCYVFHCGDCSSTKEETWTPKQANFTHMCVTALANLTWRKVSETKNHAELKFFDVEADIIPYFTENWENLTSMPRRVKNTWHQTLQKTLAKETELFTLEAGSDTRFCLTQTLADIGPNNEVVKAVGRKNVVLTQSSSGASVEKSVEDDGGPKTRGASKRKATQAELQNGKRNKSTADYTSTKLSGYANPVDYPFNREGYRYFLVETDVNAPNQDGPEDDDLGAGKPIQAYLYRIVRPCSVTLSSHDRAAQLKLSDDRLAVTGFEGYSVVRATHPVTRGRWYFEVEFLSQPPQSHIRIGWSQALAVLQACVGYDKFSYAWRSRKGTVFHESIGRHYSEGGFGEGDVLGCLIDLGSITDEPSTFYLPPSHKDLNLIKFKSHYYYEEKDEVDVAVKSLRKKPGTTIEFYRNGAACGTAFSDIYAGAYYPAISLYRNASVRCNFGPHFRYGLPANARSFHERAEEMHIDQAMADLLYFVENETLLR